jgi:hypothetical protein
MGHTGHRLANWMEEKIRGTGGRISFDVVHRKDTCEIEFSISFYEDRHQERAIKKVSATIVEELMPCIDSEDLIEAMIERFIKDGVNER